MLEQKKNIRVVSASNFVATIAANVDNEELGDTAFRAFIRNTLDIEQYQGNEENLITELKDKI